MNITPPGLAITQDGTNATRTWMTWVNRVSLAISGVTESGATADRPVKGLWVGRMYFDTTLGQPIWYDGSDWVDATGASA